MTNPSRRSALKVAIGTAVAAPVMFIAKDAFAAKNEALRTALQYQDTPKDGLKCIDCLHFVPGADAAAMGGCAILPGDTEIAPEGWCSAYVKKPA